jgi:DUF4097 and DUF4098 domain-containing protein YvlB
MKRFFINPYESLKTDAGINLQTGKGDLQLEDITASNIDIRCAKGDVKVKHGRLAHFNMDVIRGNIQCESCLPEGNWYVSANRGDIHLSLPADTRARLDAATRQGEIKSTIPLVRVTRQGREAWRGGRMVGTMGTNLEANMPEIHLTALKGDIGIETGHKSGRQYANPPAQTAASTGGKLRTYNTPLDILQALSKRQISVDEADRLLRQLDH